MAGGQFIRVIRRREVLALAFGAMIGWSWVALTGNWIDKAGSLGAMLAFVFGGVAVILVGLTYAELASAMPQAGGEHVYSHRALGATASFICTWAILLGYVSVVAFEAVALPTVADYLVPGFSRGYLWTIAGWDVQLTWVLLGVVAAVFMTAINIIGIKTAAKLQLLVTTLVLAVGVLLIGGAGIAGSTENMQPLFDNGAKGLLGVLVMVPFMFVGFDVIPQSAEEVDIPFAEIGRTLMISIIMAVFWYVLIIAAVSMGLSVTDRMASSLPTADATAALERIPDRWQPRDLRAGARRSTAAITRRAASALQHAAQCGVTDRRAFCHGTVVWPPGAGLAGRRGRPRYRHRIRLRCLVVPGAKETRAGDATPLCSAPRPLCRNRRACFIIRHCCFIFSRQSRSAGMAVRVADRDCLDRARCSHAAHRTLMFSGQ
jgi:hypothetical protein